MSDFNGYANWETWNMVNWINSTEETYRYWSERAGEMSKEELAEELHLAMYPPVDEMECGWHKDVVTMALARVDWEEVTESIVNE
jgi:hypothetical protein